MNIKKNKDQLIAEMDCLDPSDNITYKQYYEKNIESIKAVDPSINEEYYLAKLRLTCEYGLSLVALKQWKEGQKVLEEGINLFEKPPNNEDYNLNGVQYYEHVLWNYGIALNELDQTNEAIIVFKKLQHYYPENEKYQNWINSLEASKLSKYRTLILALFAIWVTAQLTIFNKFDPGIQKVFAAIGIIIPIAIGLYEWRIRYILRRKSTKAQHAV